MNPLWYVLRRGRYKGALERIDVLLMPDLHGNGLWKLLYLWLELSGRNAELRRSFGCGGQLINQRPPSEAVFEDQI